MKVKKTGFILAEHSKHKAKCYTANNQTKLKTIMYASLLIDVTK